MNLLFLMRFHRTVSNYKQPLLANGMALAPVSPSSQALGCSCRSHCGAHRESEWVWRKGDSFGEIVTGEWTQERTGF